MQPATINKKIVRMMQSAAYLDGDCRVTIGIDDLEGRIRILSNQRSLTCPNCHRTVILKAGKIKALHFAHWDETDLDCIDEFYEPDGPEHQAMKLACLKFLQVALPDAQSVNIEVPIPETNQRADVLAVCGDGKTRYAIEVQVSPLDPDEWERRHNLYRDVGIIDIWLLGFSRLKAHEIARSSGWDIVPDNYEAYTFRLRRGSWSSPEWSLAQSTKRIYYLKTSSYDITIGSNSSNATGDDNGLKSVVAEQPTNDCKPKFPTLITFCRVSEKEATRYTFPFDPQVLRLSPKIGLVTPYDHWALRRQRQIEEAEAEARQAAIKAMEEEQQRQKIARQNALQKRERYVQKALENAERNLKQWQSQGLQMEQWLKLKDKFRLSEANLEIWNVTVPGYSMVRCDPRIWMAYLYYETVHTKIWKHQKENHSINEPLVWPRPLAAWHLRKTFFYHLNWERMNDPDYLDPVLDGFASYLSLLGLAIVLKPGERKSEVHLRQQYIPNKFPNKKTITEAQEAIAIKDREDFISYLHRTFNRNNDYILSEEADDEIEDDMDNPIHEDFF